MGDNSGCLLCGKRRLCCHSENDIDFHLDKLSCDLRETFGASFGPTILNRHGAPLDPAKFAQPLNECGDPWGLRCRVLEPRKPTTGIVGCCARAASGQAATAPPSSAMNSRRRPMKAVT